ncbi:MAG TPA: peptidase M50 [Candidatus Ruania gallistercoris]|uniref:Peptidase M50 n=1 Tax=Candidatus Ruania gallistercoris TaxID=2838746 RepID=A0A9D2EFH1_9MICO|nr:peptidase M50 [Candidatus Ruania gallistercoris]
MTSSRPAEAPRTRGWQIGTLAGAPVVVTAGWLLISAVLVVVIGPWLQRRLGLGIEAYAWALTVPLLLFVSVLAHELAHGLAAGARGIRAREYVITLWGGHTSFGTGLRSPADSAIVSVAGPAANVLLAGIGWAAGTMTAGLPGLAVLAFTYTNAFVAVFNLLPALPMDGGKLLEAAVWAVGKDRLRGTLVAGRAGQVLAITVVVVSLGQPLLDGRRPSLTTAIWAVVVGVVLWNGAHAAVRHAKAQLGARGLDLRTMAAPVVAVDASATVAELDALAAGGGTRAVLTSQSRPVALVSAEAWHAVPAPVRASTSVTAVAAALPAVAVITELQGPAAVARVARAAQAGATVVVLLDPARGPVGVVPVAEVVRHLGG